MASSSDTKVKIVDIQVKYQEAIQAMAKYAQSIADIQNHLKQLKKDLKDGKVTQEDVNRQQQAANVVLKQEKDALSTLSKQVNNQVKVEKENTDSLKALRAELSNATAAYDAMSRAEREGAKGKELKNHIVQITTELKAAEAGTLRFYRNVGNYPTEVSTTMNKLQSGFRELGSLFSGLVLSGGMLAFGKQIVEVGRTFEDAMARVRAVTQATQEELKMMRDEALKMGSMTRYTATEAANALENLTRNGLTAEQATAALGQTLFFAQANSISLAEAAEIMTNVSNGFNMGVAGMQEVSDSLSYTASHAAANVSQLAEALTNAAPFGHALGQPIEEVNAALGVLADVGVKGADAGTALRMIMLGLAVPTAKQKKVFEEYGIEIDQASIASEGLTATLQKLKASGIMEATDSASKLADVFGRRVSPQSMTLLNNVDRLQTKLDGLRDAAGTTKDMFDVSMSQLTLSLVGLKSAWEVFLISVYDANSGALIEPLEALRELVNFLKTNLSAVGTALTGLIAGISFTKLVAMASASFAAIKNSAVARATEASAYVSTCENSVVAVRQEVATLSVQAESAAAVERERIEMQLVAKKRELAVMEKALHKSKAAEVVAWERAAAIETGTRWQVSFAAAKIAMQSFVTASKVAFKGFIVTAVISTLFTVVVALFNKFKEGEGIFGKISSAAVSAFRAIADAIVSVINYWIDMYNESMLVRGVIDGIGLAFKLLWNTVKVVFGLIGNIVSSTVKVLTGMGELLMGMVSLSADSMRAAAAKVSEGVLELGKDNAATLKRYGEQSGRDFVKAFNATIKSQPVAHLKAPKVESFGTSGGGGGANTSQSLESLIEAESGGSTTSSSKTDSKEDKSRAKAAQEEAKLVAQAEQAMLDLLGECVEKRKAMLESQYNGEIAQLQAKLDTDKTLTQKSRDAIETVISAKKQKLADEIAKLDDEEIKGQIERQKKAIDSQLETIEKGSQEELDLKKQSLEAQYKLDLQSLAQEEAARQKGVASALMYRQQQLDALESSGTVTAEQLVEAQNAVDYAQQQMYDTTATYAQMRLDLMAKYNQQERQLQIDHDQQVFDEQQLALKNQIKELEIAGQQKLDTIIGSGNSRMTLEQSLSEMGLDVVTEGEIKRLELEHQAAEERLNFLIELGQLEGQTTEEYIAEKLEAEEKEADTKASLNKAMLKNEQAYAKSMASVGDSLISVIDAIGERNKAAAIASKVITLFKIAVDTGKAISSGVASAMELPYPANLAAVATTVATVLTNIATAISTVNEAGFAEGGKVVGAGTGTSDSIRANLSNGEYVMTAKATKIFEPLLAMMNQIGAGVPIDMGMAWQRAEDSDRLSDTVARAAQGINLRPVVSVVEITEAQERVKVIESLDTL